MSSTSPLSAEARVLSTAVALTGASAAVLVSGARVTRWGPLDPGGDYPADVEPGVVSQPSQLLPKTHPDVVSGAARSVLVVRLGREATLWVLSSAENHFTQAHERATAEFVPWWRDALEALAGAQQIRELASRLSSPAVFVHDEEVWMNDAACRLTGHAREALTTQGAWFSYLFGDEAAMARSLFQVERQQGFPQSRTLPITRRDGSERLVEWSATCAGPFELWLFTDVSERVASQERFRLLFDQSATAYLLFDEQAVIDCNPAAVALLCFGSKYDLVGRTTQSLSPATQPGGEPSLDKFRRMQALTHAQGGHRFDWVYLTADDAPLTMEVSLTPITLGARRVLLAEWHDVTERVRYETGLREARDTALELSRAKADFLATMSHEVRTPLNGVLGMTRLLLETPLSAIQREYAQTAHACSEGLLALINDVLDFSKLEAGKVTLEALDFSLRDVVEDALAVVAEAAQTKGLELTGLFANDVPETVCGDPTRLRQVLLNLLSNAVKFTTSGEVTVEVSVGPDDGGPTRAVLLAVSDTGIGIAPTALPRLFSPFTQEDSSITRRFGGTGLGLAICRRLVSLMGGLIDVTTSASGTTFTVSLGLPQRAPARRVLVAQGQRAVVVEPLATPARALEASLGALGLNVTVLSKVEDALPLVQRAALVLVSDRVDEGGVGQLLRAAGKVPVGLVCGVAGGTPVPRAVFTVHRPLRRRQLADAVTRALGLHLELQGNPAVAVSSLAQARVLVAEDNLVNQRVIRGLLERLGCSVTLATNGELALAALDAMVHDIVLMDCQMPELDGFETTRRLRARGQAVPVIALTASALDGDRARCVAAGMNDFLAKPVRLEELERMLALWTRRGRASTSASAA